MRFCSLAVDVIHNVIVIDIKIKVNTVEENWKGSKYVHGSGSKVSTETSRVMYELFKLTWSSASITTDFKWTREKRIAVAIPPQWLMIHS